MSSLSDSTRWLDATDQAALVASGEVTAAELVEAAVDRIEQLDLALGALTLRYFDQARAAAAVAPTGPLTGVPFLVKDLFTDVAGQVCTNANAALAAQARPVATDGPLMARYRAAGLVVVGRTASSEFGTLPTAESALWGATRNPWDTTRSAGGSSGGSAAAVATGMVPVAHGSDVAGSLRIPASCCGLVGLKPERAATRGVDSVWDLSVDLGVTRSVRDTAVLLDVVRGIDEPGSGARSAVGADPGRLRVGLLDTRFDGSSVHPACAAAARSAASLLESLGHQVEPGFPTALGDPTLDRLFGTFFTTGMAEVHEQVAAQLGRALTDSDMEPLNFALGVLGAQVTDSDRQAALDAVPAFTRSVVSWWDDHDLLVTPTLAEPPLPVGELGSAPADPMAPLRRSVRYAPFTPFVNITGQAAISLPLHVDDDGLPIGVQLVAAPGGEATLLRVAAQLEVAASWHDRRPSPGRRSRTS